jgi:Lipocalin-like domain
MTAQAPTIQPTSAQDEKSLVGAWTLVSCYMEDTVTKEKNATWGERPNGCLTLTAAGHWTVVQTSENRKAPHTDEDRAAAFRSMIAYSGRYRIEGRKIVINVDIAWDESWVGTEQVRYFRIEGDKLHIEAAPQRYANLGDRTMLAVLVWQRAT